MRRQRESAVGPAESWLTATPFAGKTRQSKAPSRISACKLPLVIKLLAEAGEGMRSGKREMREDHTWEARSSSWALIRVSRKGKASLGSNGELNVSKRFQVFCAAEKLPCCV